jgi:hypothetical protein
VCGRCCKAARQCIWTAGTETGLSFKSENAFARGRPRRPRRLRNEDPHDRRIRVAASPSPLLFTPRIPVKQLAFGYWVENFTFQLGELPDIGHEYGNHTLSYWDNTEPDSSLSLAVSAISHAVFGRAKRLSPALEDAEKHYAKSVVKTRSQIKEVSNETIDQLLITIMLMANYEVSSHAIRADSRVTEK